MKKILLIIPVLLMVMAISSCSNQDIEFDDFEYQTVYFAYQYPIRTITLGDDFVDTSMDNEGKFRIMATLGGVYSNKKNVTVDFVIDNSLLEGFRFNPLNGTELRALPANYYQLAANSMTIPKGSVAGGVEVQLTDAFFADPLTLGNYYVIPVRMVGVTNADSILSGKPNPLIETPNRLLTNHWDVLPKDYVLYGIRYVNPWHGIYLRRGVDQIAGKNGNSLHEGQVVRRKRYVEDDEVMKLSSSAFSAITMPVVLQDSAGVNIPAPIRLTFDDAGNCVVSSPSTEYTASGSGRFVKQGEKNSWGNKDRDVLYLTYEIDHANMFIATTDTLVLRNRGVGMETFTVVSVE
jgi:hypothetical protein